MRILISLCLLTTTLGFADEPRPVEVLRLEEFSEGPVFDHEGNLYVSHGSDSISRMTPDGQVSLWTNADRPNGHKVLPDGSHLLCVKGAVLHTAANGTFLTLVAPRRNVASLRSPNDLTLDGKGGFYFTDPGGSRNAPIGTVHHVDKEGKISLVAGGMWVPNGLVLSPDRTKLYVAETKPNRILWFEVLPSGALGPMQILAELPTKEGVDGPDGITVDTGGNLYVAHLGMTAVQVISPDGRLIRTLPAGNYDASNVVFGGPDMNQLFVTGSIGRRGKSPGCVFRIDLEGVRGIDPIISGDSDGWAVSIEVGADGHERRDKPVEISLDLTRTAKTLPGASPFDPREVEVLEISSTGVVVDDAVPVQFDPDENFDAAAKAAGTLIFLMKGVTRPDATRRFVIHGGEPTPRQRSPESQVSVARIETYRGQDSFKITTPRATYYYHEQGAGFASLVDADGNDWLSYHPGVGPVSKSGSGGKYRGIPNMGHPEGYCHPGNTVSKSRIVSRGPLRVSILSESEDGRMACRWDIFPHYARMTVLRMRAPYWFLFEGTPGGKLDMETDYCVRPGGENGLRTSVATRWDSDLSASGEPGEWLYFGDGDRVIYLAHHRDDDAHDSYWPMNEEMTVFGFGRKGIKKFMDRTPDEFTIGLHDGAEHGDVVRAIRSAYVPLRISVRIVR